MTEKRMTITVPEVLIHMLKEEATSKGKTLSVHVFEELATVKRWSNDNVNEMIKKYNTEDDLF